jgi:glutamine---fructose-6-phosphate transaminase (isomerizing)
MSDLRPDPDQPLPGAPDPWAGSEMPSHRGGPPFHMTEMIEAEPAFAERLLTRLAAPDGAAARLAGAIRTAAEGGSPIIVTGCGTSEHGAQGITEILREALASAGHPARPGEAGTPVAVQAFEVSLERAVGGRGALVIGVSHEGGTWATNLALERAKRAGATVAIVTVSARSPGASLADIVITTDEQDQSWCHTIGYLSPILAATAVAGHLSGSSVDPAAARSLLAAALASDAVRVTERIADAQSGIERMIVVGSGVDRPAARELVLKVEEGAHLAAAMRDLETVLHGHLAGMDERTGMVLFMTDETSADERAARAMGVLRAAAALGVATGAILGAGYVERIPEDLTPAGRLIVPGAPALPRATASLIGSAVPLQLLTERLARARGINPDPIRRDDPAWLRAAEVAG